MSGGTTRGRRGLLIGFLSGLLVSFVFLALSGVLPRLLTSDYYQRSLRSLRQQAETIKREFAILEWGLQRKKGMLLAAAFPQEKDKVFELFQKLKLRPNVEGAAYYDQNGQLAVWLGMPSISGPRFRDRLSSSTARPRSTSSRRRGSDAPRPSSSTASWPFCPRSRPPISRNTSFSRPGSRRTAGLDYSDFRDDVAGFEKFFGRHRDEYIGRARVESEIQTIFFPLRNDRREIVATVNLSSPSLRASQYSMREWLILAVGLVLILALVQLVILLARSSVFGPEVRTLPVLLLVAALAGVRLILLWVCGLERVQSLPVFRLPPPAFSPSAG